MCSQAPTEGVPAQALQPNLQGGEQDAKMSVANHQKEEETYPEPDKTHHCQSE